MSAPALRKLHPLFACEIHNADLQDVRFLNEAMDRYAVSVLREQLISDEEHIAFSRRFGELETSPHFGVGKGGRVRMRHAELFDVSNLDEDGNILAEVTAHATQPQFVYAHKWRAGDLVIWDNRCTMHRATPFDDSLARRDLRRTTVKGDLPVIHAG